MLDPNIKFIDSLNHISIICQIFFTQLYFLKQWVRTLQNNIRPSLEPNVIFAENKTSSSMP
jgi:hypothetical protein